ncbi:MAG TPA: inorganic pyrophosphatase [Myxococcales bacterium]|nr:inorganic pyrophosphatase [Myxococcales bacterium]
MNDEDLLATLFQAHPWHGVAPGDPGAFVNVYVEIVPSDVVKYELDKPSGHLRIDRPQRYSSLAPSLYGFIPQTYCGDRVAARSAERIGQSGIRGDRDPMDICVLTEKGNAHGGFFLRARPVGGLRMIDGDEADDKVLAVLENDLVFGTMEDIAQVPAGLVDRLRHYFLSYKQIPGPGSRKVQIAEVYGRAEAVEVIRRSVDDYREKFGDPEQRVRRLRHLLGAADPTGREG